MYNEFTFTAIVLLVVCAALTILNLLCSSLVSLLFGIRFGKAFCWGLLSLLLPAGALAWGLLVERNLVKVNSVELFFDSLPKSFDGYRIAHISDIHSRSFRGRTGALDRAVAKLNSLHADLVAFTGDLITVSPGELDLTGPSLKAISAPDGVISILGNHDYCTHIKGSIGEPDAEGLAELERRERALGWRLLLNESISLKRGSDSLTIVGAENWSRSFHFPSTGDLTKASAGTEGNFRILLTHDPTHWDSEVLGKGYPLTLCGHTHAAQTSLFGWSPSKYVFKRYRGLYEENGQYLYVNIGLGQTAYPVRIGTVPEITLITLRRK